jgi:hypothetical protein
MTPEKKDNAPPTTLTAKAPFEARAEHTAAGGSLGTKGDDDARREKKMETGTSPCLPRKVQEAIDRNPGGIVVHPIHKDAHLPYYKSPKYLHEEKKFGRNFKGDLTYDNRILCRHASTVGGCRRKGKCQLLHQPSLGCVYNQMSTQGCVYVDGKDCPFSHHADAVVVVAALSKCKNFQICGHSCMFVGSTCLLCFNRTSRDLRDRLKCQDLKRRLEFVQGVSQAPTLPTAIVPSVYGHPTQA